MGAGSSVSSGVCPPTDGSEGAEAAAPNVEVAPPSNGWLLTLSSCSGEPVLGNILAWCEPNTVAVMAMLVCKDVSAVLVGEQAEPALRVTVSGISSAVRAEWDARPMFISGKPNKRGKKGKNPIPSGFSYAKNGPLGRGYYRAEGLKRTDALRTAGVANPAVHWRREWDVKGKRGSVDFFAFVRDVKGEVHGSEWSAMLQYTEGSSKTSQRWYGNGSHFKGLSSVEYHSTGKVERNAPPELSPNEFKPVVDDDSVELKTGADKRTMVTSAFCVFEMKDDGAKLFADREHCLDLVPGEVGDEKVRAWLLGTMRGERPDSN